MESKRFKVTCVACGWRSYRAFRQDIGYGRCYRCHMPVDCYGDTRRKNDGTHKYCGPCKQIKPVEQFHKNANSWDGLQSICKNCHHAIRSRYPRDNYARRVRLRANGGRHTRQEWLDLCKRYDYRCLACRQQEPQITLTVDHIVPVVSGGRNDIANIQPLCYQCNNKKHMQTIDYRGAHA